MMEHTMYDGRAIPVYWGERCGPASALGGSFGILVFLSPGLPRIVVKSNQLGSPEEKWEALNRFFTWEAEKIMKTR